MTFRKLTTGEVIQVFNDTGECISQRFFAGDIVEYQNDNDGDINIDDMPLAGQEYESFDMVQPKQQENIAHYAAHTKTTQTLPEPNTQSQLRP